jgi:uncharacterized membrane protein YeaQ/YmgE (transglycosylase-associated protein family)
MDLQALKVFLVVGGIAGCLAGIILRGGGFSLIGNSILGIIGGVAGGMVCIMLGITSGEIVHSIISAASGAVILVWALRF